MICHECKKSIAVEDVAYMASGKAQENGTWKPVAIYVCETCWGVPVKAIFARTRLEAWKALEGGKSC